MHKDHKQQHLKVHHFGLKYIHKNWIWCIKYILLIAYWWTSLDIITPASILIHDILSFRKGEKVRVCTWSQTYFSVKQNTSTRTITFPTHSKRACQYQLSLPTHSLSKQTGVQNRQTHTYTVGNTHTYTTSSIATQPSYHQWCVQFDWSVIKTKMK